MAMTDQELKLALDNEEPRYRDIVARLGDSDVPRVRALAESGDVALASKAVYLASLLTQAQAHDIVIRAADSANELVRVASATALPNLPTAPRERAAERLLTEANPAVSKMVLRAIGPASATLAPKLRDLESRTTLPELKALVREKLQNN